MKLPRRNFLHLAAGGVVLPAVSRIAQAQAYPSRPVHIIVGTPSGGAPDVLARLTGQWLTEQFGQSFIIENKPGAGGNIATEAVVRASPDGHTLLLVGPGNTINATLYEKLNYNFIRDIVLIASVVRISYVMQVHSSFPAKTVSEFITYGKAHPGTIKMASPGNATAPHFVGELFKIMAGVDLVHVPYSGTMPALNALLNQEVQVYFGTVSASVEDIKAGRLRALAVTTATRSEALPNTPSIGESVPGFEASSVFGIGAPKNTPIEIVDTLNKKINARLADPKAKAQLAELGGTVLASSPAEFGKLIAEEAEKWGKVVRAANIKPA